MFTRGRTVVRRYFRATSLTWALATRVVADDDRGLLLWVPVGAGFACRVDGDGDRLREVPMDQFAAAELSVRRWQDRDVLMLVRPGAAHSVWWFFTEGRFTGWYVNLELPGVRWTAGDVAGIDTVDHSLDVVVERDRSWRWKDEKEFAEFTGQPGYWTAHEARQIRAEARTALRDVEAGEFPFDGSLRDFRPDPSWRPPALPPTGWDAPSALPPR